MITPAYQLDSIKGSELIAPLVSIKYVSDIQRPTSFQAIQARISPAGHTFSRHVIARTWEPIYNQLAIDYAQITGDDVEILCIMREALEIEGLLNITFKLESLAAPMPNESTGLDCQLLPSSEGQTFSLLIHHLGHCCQTMGKVGHTVSITNQSDPTNNPAINPYPLGRLPCGGNNQVNNFGACGISFPLDPTGQTVELRFNFVDELGVLHSTHRILTV